MHTECERSSVHPHYHTGVVQMIVGGSQGVGTCILSFKPLEGDTRVAKEYSWVVPCRWSIHGPTELLGEGKCIWSLAETDGAEGTPLNSYHW